MKLEVLGCAGGEGNGIHLRHLAIHLRIWFYAVG